MSYCNCVSGPKSIVKSVLFGYGTPANSFLPPQVPYYDKNAGGLQYDIAKAKAEMAKSKYPKGFKVQLLVGAGAQVENTIGQILQSALKQIGIIVTFKTEDTSTEFNDVQANKYQLGFSYWTMDIADPDELVTFAIDPKGGAFSFYTHYNNPTVTSLSHQAQREINPAKRAGLYSKIQRIAACLIPRCRNRIPPDDARVFRDPGPWQAWWYRAVLARP